MVRRVLAGTLVAAALAAVPAAASGRQWVVSPGGTGAVCTDTTPCTLAVATGPSGASAGDEVVVGPGTYALTKTLGVSGFSLRGAAGQPAPVLDGALVDTGSFSNTVNLSAHSAIAHVVIRNTRTTNGLYEDLAGPTHDVTVSGTSAHACLIGPLIEPAPIDQLSCVSTTGEGARFGVSDDHGSTVLRDSDFIGATSGLAIQLSSSAQPPHVSVSNSIVVGPSHDVTCQSLGFTIAVDHVASRGQSTDCAQNQLAFGATDIVGADLVDPAAGDVHQRPGSPTIDTGTADPLLSPPFDIDGDARIAGLAQDIGADEAVLAPAVATLPAAGLTAGAATLRGAVTTGGARTTARFEWGTTTAYGNTTAAQTLAPDAPAGTAASTTLDGLAANTTYHYRIVAESHGGSGLGADGTFVTRAPPVAPAPAPVPPAVTRVSVKGLTVSYALSGPGTIRVMVQRRLTGHRSGSRCSPAIRTGPACIVTTTVLVRTVRANAGPGSLKLPRSKLPKGRYVVRLKTASGTRAQTFTVR